MDEGEKNYPVFLSTAEVAEMLKYKPRSLEKMRLEGRGPPYLRFGSGGKAKVIYKLEDVLAWAEQFKV
ncbi:helix-turn-helix domain-containing protein [Hyphomicrobium sp. NDB2Meth4]|uniref:helix-turn-helix transcriptional regulator n=1 Tax=Hyphomicrobium sp. NDB2Meth4 TaxID=1892846 RepID=UPI0009316427|nr:helix-turn-helix domain-containing protein [Hyphomicrobium sp. NDB2Meth4]